MLNNKQTQCRPVLMRDALFTVTCSKAILLKQQCIILPSAIPFSFQDINIILIALNVEI